MPVSPRPVRHTVCGSLTMIGAGQVTTTPSSPTMNSCSHAYPASLAILADDAKVIFAEMADRLPYVPLHEQVLQMAQAGRLPLLLPDLLMVEHAMRVVSEDPAQIPATVARITINPTLQLLPTRWSGLDKLIADPKWNCLPSGPGEMILVWRRPGQTGAEVMQSSAAELLALKVIADDLPISEVAAAGGVAVGAVDSAIAQAIASGILLAAPSSLRRPHQFLSDLPMAVDPSYLTCQVFTVQWHITQVCDLHCKHCYDRSRREEMPLAKGLAVLDDIRAFCRERHVSGQISFSGGNPLLYPHFLSLYQAAVDRFLGVAILGNPASRKALEALCAIAKPLYYQVSLEGLAEHNDYIRGRGHFARVMEFLPLLREYGIYSMVMLTLTRDNQDQVLPLAELLEGKVDLFTFNRLAAVGEGADLIGPDRVSYRDFLAGYRAAAQHNPCMALKDNLFNLLAGAEGGDLFGGCAGYGCGAAFNFVSILADGEVHACRKFPSPIGNIFSDSLSSIYDSGTALRFRSGCRECEGCRIRPVCGGCPAVAHGMGLNVHEERDPYCWRKLY